MQLNRVSDSQPEAPDIDPQKLCEGSIFGALSPDAAQFLLDNGMRRTLRAGEALFRHEEETTSFFVVCDGQIDFYKWYKGKNWKTRSIEFGQEVGFVSMIALHDRSGDAIASKDTLVLEISTELFAQLHQHYPLDFGLMLMNLARDLARVVKRLSDDVAELQEG